MDPSRFDQITRLFAERRLSRRQAMTGTTATVAATVIGAGQPGVAQDATPQAIPVSDYQMGSYEKTSYLFVQSFQTGSISPNADDDRYTLSLEAGLGQTIYFGDRPSRDVGVTETSRFLDGLGFSEDNPPNAALLVQTDAGETDIAVLELFAPTYDTTTHTATYQVRGLESWEETLELGLQDSPSDLAGFTPEFTGAHLLIDDCLDGEVDCYAVGTNNYVNSYTDLGFCYNFGICMPCDPYGHNQPDHCSWATWWGDKCKQDNADDCSDGCYANFSGSLFLGC